MCLLSTVVKILQSVTFHCNLQTEIYYAPHKTRRFYTHDLRSSRPIEIGQLCDFHLYEHFTKLLYTCILKITDVSMGSILLPNRFSINWARASNIHEELILL